MKEFVDRFVANRSFCLYSRWVGGVMEPGRRSWHVPLFYFVVEDALGPCRGSG